MVLIVDSNKFRRERTSRYLRYDGLPSMSIEYSDFKYYTKPLVTILVDPSSAFMNSAILNEKTLYIVVNKSNKNIDLYGSIPEIVSNDGTISSEQILKIINDKLGYDLKNDKIDFIKILNDVNDISHCGARLKLCGREYKILRFFTYNQRKIFTIDEIFDYMGFNGKIKDETFMSYVIKINNKCKKVNRNKLIYKRKMGYEMVNEDGVSPDLYNPIHNILYIQEE